jgi:ribosomal protein L40E
VEWSSGINAGNLAEREKAMGEIFSFLEWCIGIIFFIWFGCTLSSINSRLGVIAGRVAADEPARLEASKPCVKCGAGVPAAAWYCTHCGGRTDGRAAS